ncbi:MAG: hypothetical protein RIT09_629 [Pseudomonadota bacterium]|jgi:hypothetical protein
MILLESLIHIIIGLLQGHEGNKNLLRLSLFGSKKRPHLRGHVRGEVYLFSFHL